MTNSLRSRQLISSFSVIMVGIVMLGSMLYWFTYSDRVQQKQAELGLTLLDVLGFLEFKEGTFQLVKDMEKDAIKIIEENQLRNNNKERFAYMIDVSTRRVVWSANSVRLGNGAGKPDNSSEVDYAKTAQVSPLLSFTIKNQDIHPTPEFIQLKPDRPPNFDQLDSTEQNIQTKRYLLAFQTFKTQPYGIYQFIVGVSMEDIDRDMQKIRIFLAVLLFLSAVLVLISQMALSFWVVAPIKDFEDEVKAIESGERENLSNEYPDELTPIQNALNGLLMYEKGQKQRYKDSLDDLAHSLKTPLAAMQNQLDQVHRSRMLDNAFDVTPALKVLETQIHRMHEIVSHQLRRAMVSTNQGSMILSQPIRPVLFRLRDTLYKVYREKTFELRVKADEYAKCRMDAEDMMELFGNLLNNACRFCKDIVEVSAHIENGMLVVDIDDDGMGFPSEDPSKLLQRGIREDSKSDGQGIGLAVSTEIVSAVGGKIELLVSPYVGARVRLHLPI